MINIYKPGYWNTFSLLVPLLKSCFIWLTQMCHIMFINLLELCNPNGYAIQIFKSNIFECMHAFTCIFCSYAFVHCVYRFFTHVICLWRYWRRTLGLQVRYADCGGYRFCYSYRGKPGLRPSVLMLHDFSAHKDTWLPMVKVQYVKWPGCEGKWKCWSL